MRTQTHRSVAIATPLGEDVLLFRSAVLTEQLGRPFQMDLDVLSENTDIAFADIVARNCTVRLHLEHHNSDRWFNGFISRFVHAGTTERMGRYRMTLVPWLWFLTRLSDCRIFQNMTVPDIVMQVFRDRGFSDFQNALTATYRPWEYCVQYRETDFSFVSRLLEHEGIYYYFEHENGRHKLILADDYASHQAYAGYETLPYFPPTGESRDQEFVSEWVVEQEVQTGIYALTDFNFTKPHQSMAAQATREREHAAAQLEMFDYPGGYMEPGDGETLSRTRLEERQAQHEIVHGRSDARGLCSGYTFTLSDFPRDSQNREYLITSVKHHIRSDEYGSGLEADAEAPTYSNAFTALLASERFRPRRLTPKPLIQGPQTAMVTGPSGEEIHTDEYGRVKVQFHWDRYAAGDDTTSCWVRVAQSWAGKHWGSMQIPRVGQEVIVEFLEGDPDRPIITGRVYNGECMPPYALPANKTRTTLKSLSSKEGSGFNEIRFEDKKGQEQLFLHAERNQDTRVKSNCYEWVGHDRHLIIKHDQLEHVENNRNEIVDADHMEKIGKDRHLKIEGKEAKKVAGSHSFMVGGDVIEVFKANHSEEVTQEYYLKGDVLVIEGMSHVTIKVGQSFIAIEESGITIGTTGRIDIQSDQNARISTLADLIADGRTVRIMGEERLRMEGAVEANLSGAQVTVEAQAALRLRGGVIQLQ